MASFFVSIFIAWVVGLYFAWSKSFGVLGWLLSMIVAIVGGFACIALLGTLMDTILTLTNFQGRLIDTNWSYLAEATLAVATVVGAWAPLELASRVNALR